MKYLIFLTMFYVSATMAAPRVDIAVGTGTPIIQTILPDSKDPNLYYFFPVSYKVSKHEGKIQFSYHETSNFWGVNGAYATMTVSAYFDKESLDLKVQEIKRQNPKATFTPVALLNSNITQLNTKLSPLINQVVCQPYGNFLGQDVGCQIDVNVKNREVFQKVIRRNIVNVLAYTYSFVAEVNGQLVKLSHSLPILFSEVGYGDYFFDSHGNVIQDPKVLEYRSLLKAKDDYYNRNLKVFDVDLKRLNAILKLCSGTKTSDECMGRLGDPELHRRFQEVTKARPADPYGQIQYEIKVAEEQFQNPRWLEILRRIKALEKELFSPKYLM